MFNNSVRRLGFACKLIDNPSQMESIKPKDACKKYNTGTTTVAWLNRQSVSAAEDRLWDLMKYNIESLRLLVSKVGTFEPSLRMVRLSSEVLPVYTEPKWGYFYKQSDVIAYAERHFATVGQIARDLDVRLSFHPGQFCVLASENAGIGPFHTQKSRFARPEPVPRGRGLHGGRGDGAGDDRRACAWHDAVGRVAASEEP